MSPVATCSICFEDLIMHTPAVPRRNGQASSSSCSSPSASSLSAAPCGHVFHTRCVAKWVEGGDSRGDCPQCRRPAEKLVRLFLAGDDQAASDHSAPSADGAVGPKRDAGASSAAVMEDKLQLSQREVEEGRIIQDVLQCQLQDMEREVRCLRAAMSAAEEHLGEKVREVSALEAQLLEERTRQEEVAGHCRRAEALLQDVEADRRKCVEAAKKEVHASVLRDLESLERRDRERQQMVSKLHQKLATKEREVKEKAAGLREAQEIIQRMQAQIQVSPSIGDDDNFIVDVGSLYETVDDANTSTQTATPGSATESDKATSWSYKEEQQHHRKRQSRTTVRERPSRNVLLCVKSAIAVFLGVALFLALFVVLPLKIIFLDD